MFRGFLAVVLILSRTLWVLAVQQSAVGKKGAFRGSFLEDLSLEAELDDAGEAIVADQVGGPLLGGGIGQCG